MFFPFSSHSPCLENTATVLWPYLANTSWTYNQCQRKIDRGRDSPVVEWALVAGMKGKLLLHL